MGFLGKYHWILDGFSHFRVYYGFYFLVLGLVSLLFKQKWISITNVSLSILIFGNLFWFYNPQNSFEVVDEIKILSVNLLSSNSKYEEIFALIENENPDIILFQELTHPFSERLPEISGVYQHSYLNPSNGVFGIGFLSKTKFNFETLYFTSERIPSIIIKLENKNLVLIGTHPPPPISEDLFKLRNQQFDSINIFVRALSSEVVVIGDLNTTSFSPNFSRITEGTSLRDSRLGFGLQPSWNAQIPFISVAIDHVLVSKEIKVTDRRVGADIGSDHLPVIIEIAI